MQTHRDETTTRDELRQLTDEVELKIHLASMEARDQWADLKRRAFAIEQRVAASSERAGDTIAKEIGAIGHALRKLRDDIVG